MTRIYISLINIFLLGTYGWASESIQDFIDTENEGVYLGMPLPLETSEEETTADIPSPQVIPYVKGS